MQVQSFVRSRKVAVAMGLVLPILAGVVFEQIGQRLDRRRYPQIGQSVDIGGRTLNIFCSGQGGPAVVFDTYGHMSGYSWNAVQSEVAKFNRACWYDRAAYGWSEPGPMPPTYHSVASDLHALLQAARVPPPYVFVGASEATFHIRVFHGLYPTEVGGVVMANAFDVGSPSTALPAFVKSFWAYRFGSIVPAMRTAGCLAFPTFARIGLVRLVGLFQSLRPTPAFGLEPEEQQKLDFLSDNPTAERGGEACTRVEGAEQVRAAGSLGDRPLIVLASAQAATAAENDPGLARLSSRGRLVVVEDRITAGAIVSAVRDVVNAMATQQ